MRTVGMALDELAAVDPALANVVDLKFFCGQGDRPTARSALGEAAQQLRDSVGERGPLSAEATRALAALNRQ